KALQVCEEIIAQIEFDVARDADDDPASQKLKDPLGEKNSDDPESVVDELGASDRLGEVVNRGLDDARELSGDSIGQQDRQSAQHEAAAVTLQIGNQRP